MIKFKNAVLTATIFSAALFPKSWRPGYLQMVVTFLFTLLGSQHAVVLGHYARCKMMAANCGAELGIRVNLE